MPCMNVNQSQNSLLQTVENCIANIRANSRRSKTVPEMVRKTQYRNVGGAGSVSNIREYVIRSIQNWDQMAGASLQIQVVGQVSTRADGLWLYARLLVDKFLKLRMEKVEQSLRPLPRGLPGLLLKCFARPGHEWTSAIIHLPNKCSCGCPCPVFSTRISSGGHTASFDSFFGTQMAGPV
jgi:hypothetical protein